MFGHLPELVIIMVIALIVFGPEKLPEAAATAGKMLREVRQALDGAMNPTEEPPADDFSAYYYESLERSGESGPEPPSEEEAAEIWPHLGGAVAGTEMVEATLPDAETWPEPDGDHDAPPHVAAPADGVTEHEERSTAVRPAETPPIS